MGDCLNLLYNVSHILLASKIGAHGLPFRVLVTVAGKLFINYDIMIMVLILSYD